MDTTLARQLIRIRLFEEALLGLFSEGRLHGTVHTCIGQELVAVAVAGRLGPSDWIFSNHRCHGHYLAADRDPAGLLAEIMGLESGICAGRGGSQHLYKDRFLSNGVQGGGIPIAAGCAMALRRTPGNDGIAVAFIGDGTLGQGVLYETLNIASAWRLPLLVVVEHNGYAQSTATTATIAGGIRARFEAFGLKAWEADIWDPARLLGTAADAIAHVRSSGAPAVLVAGCYRLKAHSKGDDNRAGDEVASFLARDPIELFAKASPDEYRRISAECSAELARILADLDARPPRSKPAGPAPEADAPVAWTPVTAPEGKPQRVLERLRAGLGRLLEQDPRVVLLGEDIEDPYGGAFKVTKGLTDRFPGRVRNTPISEAALVGVGNGLALAGLRPVVEVMFGDFITLAADQIINQAAKFAYMYADQVSIPLVVRTPMGGKRGYGATHSQSLEKHFLGTPGLVVACVNPILDPAELLARIHRHVPGPCLLVENKLAYGSPVRDRAPDGRRWEMDSAPLPTLRLPAGRQADVTLVAHGGMTAECEDAARIAFEQHEVAVEILVPTCLHPLDARPIVGSVARTGRLVTVEEGQGFAGLGAEVVARCAEAGLAARCRRVAAKPHPIPCARDLERDALPGTADILAALLDAMTP